MAFPLLFFVLLEGSLQYFDYGDNLKLFVPAPAGFADAEYLTVNRDVAKRYFTRVGGVPRPVSTHFLRDKPANGYRIFMLGGSTVAGWPYPNNVLPSRLLNQRLSDTFPDREIEVVNTGIAALNSHSLLDFMDEVIAQEPDAILIYTGHNEFYGALGAASTETLGRSRWIIKTYLALLRFKTVQWLRDATNTLQRQISGRSSSTPTHSAHPTLMGKMIGDQNLPYGGPIYRRAKAHYRDNLSEILERARDAGIAIIISELVSNVRDHAPFVSEATAEHSAAADLYRQARALEAEGDYERAREFYYRAKDLDALRFRATEEFNEVIHDVARKYGTPLVPMKSYFEEASPNGLIGARLILEHLHPTSDGYALIASAFFDTIRQNGLIQKSWPSENTKSTTYYAEHWPVTDLDRAIGRLRTVHLMDHWPFTPLSEPGRGFTSFQPASYAEELAYRMVKKELNFISAHVAMAEYYEAAGNYELAYREYLALIRAEPYNVKHYLLAAKNQIEHQRFENALELIRQSLQLKNTGAGNKWAGQILLHYHQPDKALPFLETAAEQLPRDARLFYMLGGAYALSGDPQRARQALSRLQTLQPNYSGTPTLEKLISDLE